MKILGIKNQLFDSLNLKNSYFSLKDKQEEYKIYIKGSQQAIEDIRKGKGFSIDYNNGIRYYENNIQKYKLLLKFSKLKESFFKYFLDIKEPSITFSYIEASLKKTKTLTIKEFIENNYQEKKSIIVYNIKNEFNEKININNKNPKSLIINEITEIVENLENEDTENGDKLIELIKKQLEDKNSLKQENNIELS